MNKPSHEPTVDLKQPYLAALLTFLLPGAGQLYQGRRFKAAIYFVGIMLLFLWGMQIGQWRIMYRLEPESKWDPFRHEEFGRIEAQDQFDTLRTRLAQQGHEEPSRKNARNHWGFWAQAPVGIFTLFSFIQEERYYSHRNVALSPQNLEFTEEIEGLLDYIDNDRNEAQLNVVGVLSVKSEQGVFGAQMQGTFEGTSGGKPIKLKIQGQVKIDPPLSADSRRAIECRVVEVDSQEIPRGELIGFANRSFFNHFLVPPDYATIEHLHGELGKKYSLAEVFTWIAGMLNVLAIWDALSGPAYGYRLRRQKEDEESGEKSPAPAAPATHPQIDTPSLA